MLGLYRWQNVYGIGDIDYTSLCSFLSLILRGHPFDRACTKGWRRSYAAAGGNYWRRRQPDLSQRAGAPAGFDRIQPDWWQRG